MADEILVLGLAVLLALLLAWAFRRLPEERWQFLASVPRVRREGDGHWEGINYTYYGVLVASATLGAALVFVFLLGTVGIGPLTALLLLGGVMAGALPAAGLVARLVERKRYTFTVGGASFVGLLLAPWIALALFRFSGEDGSVLSVLSAAGVAYAFGEGLGRLACISFGCCYGKPLHRVRPWLRRLVHPWAFVFHGSTRKIAYADGLEGRPVVPIQAVTSVIYLLAALTGFYLGLNGRGAAAFLVTIGVTQAWRFVSEFFRDDERGGRRITAYQAFALLALLYAVLLVLVLPPVTSTAADLLRGARAIWNPGVLLLGQGLWLAVFLHTGRSRVTASRVSFHVLRDRI
jgi:prolipoprotein diacylglyceryltransferase